MEKGHHEKSGQKKKSEKSDNIRLFGFFWRKRWDSNPRAREDYLISSRSRHSDFGGKQEKFNDDAGA